MHNSRPVCASCGNLLSDKQLAKYSKRELPKGPLLCFKCVRPLLILSNEQKREKLWKKERNKRITKWQKQRKKELLAAKANERVTFVAPLKDRLLKVIDGKLVEKER